MVSARRSAVEIQAILVSVALVGFVLWLGRFLFLPLVLAFLLCLMFRPLVRRMEARGVPWGVTVALVMVLLGAALFFVGREVVENARAFLDGIEWEDGSVATVAPEAPPEPADAFAALRAALEEDWVDAEGRIDRVRAVAALQRAVPKVAGVLVAALGAVLGFVNQLLLVLFFMLFIFAEQSVSYAKMLRAAGERREAVAAMLAAIDRDAQRYLVAKTSISLATGVCCGVGLWIVGVPYAAVFGLLTFLLDFIPNVGSLIAAVFPLVVAWTHFGAIGPVLAVAGIYLAVNVVFGNFVEPRVLGRQLDLSPLVVLLAVMFWSALWGVPGMFLAVPLTRTAQIVFQHVPALRPVAILMSSGANVEAVT